MPIIFLISCLILDRYSILPALSLDGILHVKVLDHLIAGADFLTFIKGLLEQMQPWSLPNSVLVMDNAAIHRVDGIHEMIKCYARTGCLSRREVSLSGISSGLSALATCDADMW